MQCFEAEATRTFLLALCRELNPALERDDLLLDDVLSELGIDTVAKLYRLGEDALSALVARVADELPLAA